MTTTTTLTAADTIPAIDLGQYKLPVNILAASSNLSFIIAQVKLPHLYRGTPVPREPPHQVSSIK
jgi:hypothetical protein